MSNPVRNEAKFMRMLLVLMSMLLFHTGTEMRVYLSPAGKKVSRNKQASKQMSLPVFSGRFVFSPQQDDDYAYYAR
jgi:hypothetical protein